MPEVEIEIGGRPYQVACQDGEQEHLLSAAATLNEEATHLINATGRLPEQKVLLMAGLMLADKMAALRENVGSTASESSAMETSLKEARARIAELEAEQNAAPETVVDTDALERMAAAAEELAEQVKSA